MWRKTVARKLSIIWLLAGLIVVAPEASAQDYRLIIDLSGSMKQSDPRTLRAESLRLFINHLSEGDRAGVWTFANQVNMLVPLASVTEDWKEAALDQISNVTSEGQWTNIGGALETATQDLVEQGHGARVILLSDGFVDISADAAVNQREKQRIFQDLIPDLVDKGIEVHSLILTEDYDPSVIIPLIRGTGGSLIEADSLPELEEHLMEILNQDDSLGEVPLVSNQFMVDKTTRSFTATLFKKSPADSIKIFAPDGQYYHKGGDYHFVDWVSEDSFEKIRVTLPRAGMWKIEGRFLPESQVVLDTDIGVNLSTSSNVIFPGEPVDVDLSVTSFGQPVVEPAYLRLLDTRASLSDDSGSIRAIDTRMEQGGFSLDMEDFSVKPGVYQLTTTISGPDFVRQVSGSLRVLDHMNMTLKKLKESYALTLVPVNQRINKSNVSFKVLLTMPDGSAREVEPRWHSQGFWQSTITSDQGGNHQLTISASARLDDRTQSISFSPQQLVFSQPAVPVADDIASAGEDSEGMAEEGTGTADGSDSTGMAAEADPESKALDEDPEFTDAVNELLASEQEAVDSETAMDTGAESESAMESEASTEIKAEPDVVADTEAEQVVRPFVKFPIETVQILDTSQIVVVPETEGDLWLDQLEGESVPEEIAVDHNPTILDLLIWSLPAISLLVGFYLFFFKFMRHQRDLSKERNELEDMLKVEEEKAEQAALEEEEPEEDDRFPPYDEEAIAAADGMPPEDLGKETEHLFEDEIVTVAEFNGDDIPDAPAAAAEFDGGEDDDDDVFDLGDLSDLADESDDFTENPDELEDDEKTEA